MTSITCITFIAVLGVLNWIYPPDFMFYRNFEYFLAVGFHKIIKIAILKWVFIWLFIDHLVNVFFYHKQHF